MPRRVLCIESDEALRERLKAILEREGFAVDLTVSGLDGIARALTLPPDLVLADVHLSDIEGAELAARLKRERSLAAVPFVAVGDSREEHDVALAAGADGFVERGHDDTLAEEVRAFLDGKRERLPEEGERAQLKALSGAMAARLESAVAGAQRATRRVEELARLRSAFVQNLAHELSTPLTPLAGYIKILRSGRLGELSAQQQKVVDGMAGAVAKLTRIVDNLSDFANLQAGQSAITPSAIDPDALAEDVANEVKPAARDARLQVEVRPSRAGPVLADPRKLRQALANLVQNAVKFSPHGGKILVEVTRDSTRLRFSVYDQGSGVPATEMERIFEPFRHPERREEARFPGSGLGLPVARRIAEAHGGRIFVESPPHTQPVGLAHQYTGSKFVIEIPIELAGAARG